MQRRKGSDPKIPERCGNEPSDEDKGSEGDEGMQLRAMEGVGNEVG
jgi:hypothetical protein